MLERRKKTQGKSSAVPVDFTKMVNEIFTANFDAGLKGLAQLRPNPFTFDTSGTIYPDEIVLCVALLEEGQLAATSVYASVDFDPRASAPTLQEVLGACVDAIGALYGKYLADAKPEQLEKLSAESLSELEDVPFEWTSMKIENHKVHLMLDKSNPKLDQLADDWLDQHDPDFKRKQAEEEQETEKLFVTGPGVGPNKPRGSGNGGSLH